MMISKLLIYLSFSGRSVYRLNAVPNSDCRGLGTLPIFRQQAYEVECLGQAAAKSLRHAKSMIPLQSP